MKKQKMEVVGHGGNRLARRAPNPEALARAQSLDRQAKEALKGSADRYIELCRCLHEIQAEGLYVELGYGTFRDYVEAEFSASYSWVRQRISVYRQILSPEAPDVVKEAAWAGRLTFSRARQLCYLNSDQQQSLLSTPMVQIPGTDNSKKFESLTSRELDVIVRLVKHPESRDRLLEEIAEEKIRRSKKKAELGETEGEVIEVEGKEPGADKDEVDLDAESKILQFRDRVHHGLQDKIKSLVPEEDVTTITKVVKYAIRDITKKYMLVVQEEGSEILEDGPDRVIGELTDLIEDAIEKIFLAIGQYGLETVCRRLRIPQDA